MDKLTLKARIAALDAVIDNAEGEIYGVQIDRKGRVTVNMSWDAFTSALEGQPGKHNGGQRPIWQITKDEITYESKQPSELVVVTEAAVPARPVQPEPGPPSDPGPPE